MGIGQHLGVEDVDVSAGQGVPLRSEDFGQVFDQYFAAIHGYLTRRLGRTRADDLAGEVFRTAYVNLDRYNPQIGAVRPWLYGIANNVMRRHLRDGERAERAWSSLKVPVQQDAFEESDERLEAWRQTSRIQVALDDLLPADREALVLHAVEGLTYEEVALVMSTPMGTVRSRIHRARSRLRVALAPHELSFSESQGDTDCG